MQVARCARRRWTWPRTAVAAGLLVPTLALAACGGDPAGTDDPGATADAGEGADGDDPSASSEPSPSATGDPTRLTIDDVDPADLTRLEPGDEVPLGEPFLVKTWQTLGDKRSDTAFVEVLVDARLTRRDPKDVPQQLRYDGLDVWQVDSRVRVVRLLDDYTRRFRNWTPYASWYLSDGSSVPWKTTLLQDEDLVEATGCADPLLNHDQPTSQVHEGDEGTFCSLVNFPAGQLPEALLWGPPGGDPGSSGSNFDGPMSAIEGGDPVRLLPPDGWDGGALGGPLE